MLLCFQFVAFVNQAEEFYQGIYSDDKDLHIFKLRNDGSNDHCQLDNRSRGHR